MLFRFLLICSPVCAVLMFIFPIMLVPLVFFGTLIVMWLVLWGTTNAVVRHFTPGYHDALKAGGGDPFLDNLGAPLNMDSEDVRQQGAFPNVVCPHCGVGSFVQPGATVPCPSCGGRFTHG